MDGFTVLGLVDGLLGLAEVGSVVTREGLDVVGLAEGKIEGRTVLAGLEEGPRVGAQDFEGLEEKVGLEEGLCVGWNTGSPEGALVRGLREGRTVRRMLGS